MMHEAGTAEQKGYSETCKVGLRVMTRNTCLDSQTTSNRGSSFYYAIATMQTSIQWLLDLQYHSTEVNKTVSQVQEANELDGLRYYLSQ